MPEDAGFVLYVLFMMLAEFAVPVIVVFLIVHFVKKRNRERAEQRAAEQSHITPLDLSDPTCKKLADEVVAVVNDMLEIGNEAHFYSSDYSGVISVSPRCHQATGVSIATYHVRIAMLSIGDLRDGIKQYPKRYYNSENSEKLDRFISKYSFCYSRSDNAYIYQTNASIVLPKDNQQKEDALVQFLHKQIFARCPLAGERLGKNAFYTKNVIH